MTELYDSLDQPRTDYDSFKEYLFNTERDREDEVTASTRLECWQGNALKWCVGEMGCNKTKILNRLYNMGTKVVRDCLHLVEHIQVLWDEILQILNYDCYTPEIRKEKSRFLEEIEVDPDSLRDGTPDIGRPYSYSVKDSVKSEVYSNYMNQSNLESTYDRYIISAGLTMVQDLPEWLSKNAEMMTDLVGDIMMRAVERMEKAFNDTVSKKANSPVYEDPEKVEKLKEVQDKMKTEEAEELQRWIATIESRL